MSSSSLRLPALRWPKNSAEGGLLATGAVVLLGGAYTLYRAIRSSPADAISPSDIPSIEGRSLSNTLLIALYNPSSGSQLAGRIAARLEERVAMSPIAGAFHSLPIGQESFDTAVALAKAAPDSVDVRIIVLGGDGSVSWCLGELKKAGLSTRVAVATVPVGSGNDLAQFLGWGRKPRAMSELLGGDWWKNDTAVDLYLARALTSEVVAADVWTVTMESKHNGHILRVRGGKEEQLKSKKIELPLVNYLSIGNDARLVYEVELSRPKSRWGTRVMYALQGLKITLGFPLPFSAFMTSLVVDEEPIDYEWGHGPMAALMALNIGTYGGGCPLWKVSKAVRSPGHPLRNLKCAPQGPCSLSDGMLDLVAVKTMFQLGCSVTAQRPMFGGLTRMAQGKDIAVEFKGIGTRTIKGYAQVDGEAHCVVNPARIAVSHSHKQHMLRSRNVEPEFN